MISAFFIIQILHFMKFPINWEPHTPPRPFSLRTITRIHLPLSSKQELSFLFIMHYLLCTCFGITRLTLGWAPGLGLAARITRMSLLLNLDTRAKWDGYLDRVPD